MSIRIFEGERKDQHQWNDHCNAPSKTSHWLEAVPAIWALTHGWIKPVTLHCTIDQKQLYHLDKNTQTQSHERQTKTSGCVCVLSSCIVYVCICCTHHSYRPVFSLSPPSPPYSLVTCFWCPSPDSHLWEGWPWVVKWRVWVRVHVFNFPQLPRFAKHETVKITKQLPRSLRTPFQIMRIPQISHEEMSLCVFVCVSEKVGLVSTLYTPTFFVTGRVMTQTGPGRARQMDFQTKVSVGIWKVSQGLGIINHTR